MRARKVFTWIAAAIILPFCAATGMAQSSQKCPPPSRMDDAKDTYGTMVVADPYRWLEDQNSPETRAWIDAEEQCTEAAIRKLPGRESVTARMKELYNTDTYSTPIEQGGRYFFSKRAAGQDLFLIYMRASKNGADELLIDPLPWSKDHSVSANIENVSKDGKYLFYSRREGGQDEVTVHVMDVTSHKDLPDVLPSATYFSVEPTLDNRGVYYTKATPDGPRAYYHAMGSHVSQDKLMYGDKLTKEHILIVGLSDDGKYLAYLVLVGSGSEKSEVYLQDVKDNGPVVTVVNEEKAFFYPSFGGDTLYLQTNWKAPKWHVYAVNRSSPSVTNWREVVPASDLALESFSPIGGKLFAQYLRNASSEIKIFEPDGTGSKELSLPTLGSASVSGRWESPEVFYSFTSFSYPTTIFSYGVKGGQSSVWSKMNVPIDPNAFETKQVWFESKDKTRVPIFLFYKKGIKRDGNNPVILSGYGGFDVNETPSYSSVFVTWAEHGGIYALVNLRGGGEFGEDWHRAGMLGNKQNVFDDFEGAAEYLIAQNYTKPAKLAIEGGSNGGLLVGAALTQRPDLYQAVICVYPLLDMLRFQKFLDGPYWVPEYGSADKPEQFEYLHKYSPYHNVKKGTKYPSVLFITGDGDTRVAPLHARKMAALLQASTGSERPVLLLYDTKSGHSGGRPTSKIIEEWTDAFSYLFWQLKM